VRDLANVLIGMAVVYIGLAACYEPSLRSCSIACTSPEQCIGTQVCLPEGYCADPNVRRCDEGEPILVDASLVTSDTAPPPVDAIDLCAQGCSNGTCIGGVCTIDCSATGSCTTDVACPANLPCHVICGDAACDHKVNCTMAASCKVDCVGQGSCVDEIQCPGNRPCDVTCSGADSCHKRVKCANSCACDVTCSGSGACDEASECPEALCRVGNGCSSQPATCNDCP
jgi:hypothetical protein